MKTHDAHMSEESQRDLAAGVLRQRLSFAALSAKLTTNNSHEHAIDFGNNNGHLPLWWIRR
jgi:hypothetical protein